MDFTKARSVFEARGIDFSKFETSYTELVNRIEESIEAHTPEIPGELRAIREYSLVLRQIHLHRAINLFEGAIDSLLNANVYSMVLSIRGHFETTAALGYLHNRLISFREGALDAKDIYQEILVQILGTREEGLLKKASQFDMEAIQVLNLFKYADRSVTKHILEGKSEEKEMLTTCYKFLCEFCHPNFHSNLVAYELIKEQNKFRFLYDKKVADRDFGVVGHLLISNPLFIEFFDKVETLIPQG